MSEKYSWMAIYVTPQPAIADALRSWRADYTKIRDGLLLGGKPYKALAAHYLRLQRACTLMIPWFGEADRGQQPVRPAMWPHELSPELDLVTDRITMEFG